MKLRAHRDYRNDISDAIGILIEENDSGKNITFTEIHDAYVKLYNEDIPDELSERMKQICNMDLAELRAHYIKQNYDEQMIGGRVISYIDDGVNINARNVDDVIARIKEKMEQ